MTRPGDTSDPFPMIPEGAAFEGLLAFRGAARIDGKLTGQVVASGLLEIGAGAEVKARIEVDELVVAGRLEGSATATRRLELRPGAQVIGDLRSPSLSLADGCQVEGKVEMASAGPPVRFP
jgi:cytoskeletal protein CcmA (bactofilin family)